MFLDNSKKDPLSVNAGDFLLLKHGQRDFVVHVQNFDARSGMVTFQYLNARSKEDQKNHTNLQLVWRTEDGEEIYHPKLNAALTAKGFAPYVDQLHIDEFYQKKVDLLKKQGRYYLPKIRKAHIKKHPRVAAVGSSLV